MDNRKTTLQSDPFRVSSSSTQQRIYGIMMMHSLVIITVVLCGLVPFLQTGFAFTYDRFLDDKSMFPTPLTYPPYNNSSGESFLILVAFGILFGRFIAPLTTCVMVIWAWQRWQYLVPRIRWIVASVLLLSCIMVLFLWSPFGGNMGNWLLSWLE